jgi:plastocyanin
LVRIEFTSTSGYHDWVVDEFDAATEKVSDGESSFVEFVALGSGSFEYYCSVGSHRAAGMEGKFIVR